MKDFVNSVFDHFSQRLRTQLYGIFAFWWVVLHGDFFYSLLFLDEDKIYKKTGLLKNEYLQQFLRYDDPYFWLRQLLTLLAAGLLTYLMIWVVPRQLLLRAYKKEREHEFEKRKIRLEYEKASERLRAELDEQTTKTLEAKAKKVKAENRIMESNPTVLWEEEFAAFAGRDEYEVFDELIACLYEHDGLVRDQGFSLGRDLLAYADANGLVDYDRGARTVTLTDKGKYFIKRYQTEEQKG